jgi:hypothetical protein
LTCHELLIGYLKEQGKKQNKRKTEKNQRGKTRFPEENWWNSSRKNL